MEYQEPIGDAPGASYVQGGPTLQGSIVPARAIEDPMREIVNAISAQGLTPAEADLTQLGQAIERSAQTKIVAISSTTSLNASHRDRLILATNAITLTLPNAGATPAGWSARIVNHNTSGQVVNVATAGGSLVLPRAVVSSLKLPERADALEVVCDGANWQVLQWTANPQVIVGQNGDLTVPHNTFTKVALNSAALDPFGEFNTSLNRYAPSVPGPYSFSAVARFAAGMPGGSELVLALARNGTVIIFGPYSSTSAEIIALGLPASSGCSLDTSLIVQTGDFFELFVFQRNSSSASATVQGNGLAVVTYLEARRRR
jgi:hypothetical protein